MGLVVIRKALSGASASFRRPAESTTRSKARTHDLEFLFRRKEAGAEPRRQLLAWAGGGLLIPLLQGVNYWSCWSQILEVAGSSLEGCGCAGTYICGPGWGRDGWAVSYLLMSSGALRYFPSTPSRILLRAPCIHLQEPSYLPLPKLPVIALVGLFLVWVKTKLSPLSLDCTCLVMIPPHACPFSLPQIPVIFHMPGTVAASYIITFICSATL